MNIKLLYIGLALGCFVPLARAEKIDFDSLAEEAIELDIDTNIKTPSAFMLAVRKLSYPVLFIYLLYQKCKSKLIYMIGKLNHPYFLSR